MGEAAKVVVTKKGVQRLEDGHVWIYRSDVVNAFGVNGGAAVRVVDQRGWFVATALYSSKSQIALRMLSRDDITAEAALAERLKLAVELRNTLFPGVSAVRLVHGEADLLPGLVVDRYGTALSIQTLTEAMEQRKEWIVNKLVELTGATVVVERNDVFARKHEGLDSQLKGVLRGTLPGPVEYREGDIALEADLLEGQKTGAFLDQRENHLLAGGLAHGRTLDCFTYNGGFALQLARKATTVRAVDASDRAIGELKRNADRNALTNIEGVVANAFDFLRQQSDAKEQYDVIVLDPPAFTKNKDSIDAAVRGYKEINLRAFQLLRPGGILVSASCSFHVDEARFAQMLLAAATDAGRRVQILEVRGAGRDHPVLMGVPETKYLKCFFVRAI